MIDKLLGGRIYINLENKTVFAVGITANELYSELLAWGDRLRNMDDCIGFRAQCFRSYYVADYTDWRVFLDGEEFPVGPPDTPPCLRKDRRETVLNSCKERE